MLRRMVGVMRGTTNVSECMDNVSSKEGASFVEPTPLVVHAVGILIFERIRTPSPILLCAVPGRRFLAVPCRHTVLCALYPLLQLRDSTLKSIILYVSTPGMGGRLYVGNSLGPFPHHRPTLKKIGGHRSPPR